MIFSKLWFIKHTQFSAFLETITLYKDFRGAQRKTNDDAGMSRPSMAALVIIYQ